MNLQQQNSDKLKEILFFFQMFGRTLKASIANDNGRSAEFIKK